MPQEKRVELLYRCAHSIVDNAQELAELEITSSGGTVRRVTGLDIMAIAVLDGKLLTGLPAHLTAATGMDAMTHGMDAICSSAANSYTDACAMAGVKQIVKYLPLCIADGSNAGYRQRQLEAR